MSRPSAPAATPAALLAALRIPSRGRVYKLAMLLSNDKPLWPAHGPYLHFNLLGYVQGGRLTSKERPTPRGGMLIDRVEMPLHAGTHVDALNHYAVHDRLFDGSIASEVESGEGATVLGVETMEPFVSRGVLLDVAALHGVPILPAGHGVTADDLERARVRQGLAPIGAGDVVLVHTGWGSLYEKERRRYFEQEPGLVLSAAVHLADAGIRAAGLDNSALELVPSGDPVSPYPVHEELLTRRGIHILENMVTAEIAADGVGEFLFVAAPLAIRGGSGSPLTPLAIV